MGLLDLFFRTKQPAPLPSGAVTVRLHGPMLEMKDKLLSETEEFSALQDRLIEAMEAADVGFFESNEVDDHAATLFLYGSDTDRLFAQIEPVLRSSPLGAHAQVTLRNGGPGSPERIVQL